MLQKLLFDMNVNESAGPCQGNIFDGSLVHREKEHMCVCLLSPFLNTTSLFPSFLPQLPPTFLSLGYYHFCSLVHPSPYHLCMMCQ